MAIMSDFGSVLQLGVALGLGLSVFRAPVDLKVKAIEEGLDQEWRVIDGVRTARAEELKGDLATLKLDYHRAKIKIEAWLTPILALTLLGALGNWAGLAFAALYPSTDVTNIGKYLILFMAIFFFILVVFVLEIIARVQLSGIQQRLHRLRIGA